MKSIMEIQNTIINPGDILGVSNTLSEFIDIKGTDNRRKANHKNSLWG